MFFKLLITIFGIAFVNRTYKKQIEKGILSRNLLTKWVFATVVVSFFVLFKFSGSDFAYWICFSAAICTLQVTIFVTRTRRESKFREEFLNFMDRMVLQMQSGRSFRSSLHFSNETTQKFFKPKLEKIIENVLFAKKHISGVKNEFISEILEEFILIDQVPHRSLQRLIAFRHRLKTQDDIRRRSGQKQRQLRTQSYILTFLYVASLIFLHVHFDLKKSLAIVAISFGFFVMGTFQIFRMGKKNLWKI